MLSRDEYLYHKLHTDVYERDYPPVWQHVFYWPKRSVWPIDAEYVTYDPCLKDTGQGIKYPVTGVSSCQWMIPGTHG